VVEALVRQNIVEALYMAVKQPVIWAKCGKNLNLQFRTSEITSAGILGTIQQTLVQQSLDLPDLFFCPCYH